MLRDKTGDQQARAEVLGKLISGIGDKSYMLQYGTGRGAYHLVLVHVSDAEIEQVAGLIGKDPVVIKMGRRSMLPLQLEEGMRPGEIEGRLYDASAKRWTGTISVTRYM